MKKRLIAIAAGAAVVAGSAAIPLSSAHGVTRVNRSCPALETMYLNTQEQLGALIEANPNPSRSVRLQEQLLEAQLSQLARAMQAANCPTGQG